MPDIQQLVITDLADITATVPRFQISCQVRDSQTNALLNDFTGANTFNFPGVLTTLTAQQKKSLLRGLVRRIIQMKAGLDDGSVTDV